MCTQYSAALLLLSATCYFICWNTSSALHVSGMLISAFLGTADMTSQSQSHPTTHIACTSPDLVQRLCTMHIAGNCKYHLSLIITDWFVMCTKICACSSMEVRQGAVHTLQSRFVDRLQVLVNRLVSSSAALCLGCLLGQVLRCW